MRTCCLGTAALIECIVKGGLKQAEEMCTIKHQVQHQHIQCIHLNTEPDVLIDESFPKIGLY